MEPTATLRDRSIPPEEWLAAAWWAIKSRHRPGYIKSRSAFRTRADVVQDAMLAICVRLRNVPEDIITTTHPVHAVCWSMTKYKRCIDRSQIPEEHDLSDDSRQTFGSDYRFDRSSTIAELLSGLSEREQDIVTRRYAIGCPTQEIETLEQVSARYGITRERVRQIECRAIRKMQAIARAKQIKNPLEEYEINGTA